MKYTPFPTYKEGERLTIGDIYRPAMGIKDPEDAGHYFELLMDYVVRDNAKHDKQKKSREELELIQKSNLGYFSGYYDAKTMARVQNLFNCVHPIFGGVRSENDVPDAAEAFRMGQKLAAKELNPHEQPVGKKKVRSRTLIID